MKGFRWFVVVSSLAFAVFSAAYGERYDSLRGGSSIFGSSADHTSELDDIQSIVKAVSMVYYLLHLGLFVRGLTRSPWRKLCVLGIVASAVMVLWSAALDRAVSFDEVYPAWIVAALVLPSLLLVMSRSPAATPIAALGALFGALALCGGPGPAFAQAPTGAASISAGKKTTPATTHQTAPVRRQLRAILETQTEAMFECEAMRADLRKLLIEGSSSIDAMNRLGNELEACLNGIRAVTVPRFDATKASARLRQEVWSEWVNAVQKRYQEKTSAGATGKEKP